MTQPVGDQLNVFLHDGDKTIWSTAALVLAIQGAATDEQQAAAHAVLEVSGLDGVASLGPGRGWRFGGAGCCPHPSSRLPPSRRRTNVGRANRTKPSSPRAGRAPGAPPALRTFRPAHAGRSTGSIDDGARTLDVGTGVAALAVAYAELFPRLTVVGIDVLPRVLALAGQTVAAEFGRRPGRPARTGRELAR